jgi:hypothetical protein
VKLQPFLVELFAREEWSRKPGLAKAKFRKADWDLMGKLVSVLQVMQRQHIQCAGVSQCTTVPYCANQVFYEATLQLSHASSCISEVVPVTTILLDALAQGKNDAGVIGYKFNLRSRLRESMGDFEKDPTYAVATLLDPRYKATFFQDVENVDAAKKNLIAMVKAELPHDEASEPDQPDRRSSTSTIGELEQHENVSIMGAIAKRIKLDKEQQVGVHIVILNPVYTCPFAGRGNAAGDA